MRQCTATYSRIEGGKAPLAAAEKSRSDMKAGATKGNPFFLYADGCVQDYPNSNAGNLSSLLVGYQTTNVKA